MYSKCSCYFRIRSSSCGTLISGKWCLSDGVSVQCNQDVPSGSTDCSLCDSRFVNSNGDTITGNFFVPIVYDYNNNAYYIDSASISNLNEVRMATARANTYYDLGDVNYYLDPASTSQLNDVRANIIYDRNNNAYYLDPASTTRVNNLIITGTVALSTAFDAIALEPTDSPTACSSTTEGGIYYDKSLRKPCYCNGSAWTQIYGKGTC